MAGIRRLGEVLQDRMRFEWRIPTFLSLLEDTFEDRYLSNDFAFDSNIWNLEILLNAGTSQFVDIRLHRLHDSFAERVKVGLGVMVNSQTESDVCDRSEFLAEGTKCWGKTHLFLKRDLLHHPSRYLDNGTLHIFCYITSEDVKSDLISLNQKEEEDLDDKSYFLLRQHLDAMRLSSEDCDITLRVSGQYFRVHSSILRARSPVFNGMLSHDMIERKSGVVTIDNCDPTTFDNFLQYVYTGSLKELSLENAIPLFFVADMYDFPALRDQCLTFLKDNMCSSMVCDVFHLATLHCEEDLLDRATEFFTDHLVEILEEEESWLSFLETEPDMANRLFKKSLKFLLSQKSSTNSE